MTTYEMRRKIDGWEAQRTMIEKRLYDANTRLTKARTMQIDLDVVQNTVQYLAARVQKKFGDYVGNVVTKALHYVFPERRRDFFIAKFVENRGKTECKLLIRTTEGEEAHPYHCSGGGVWNTISFALQCACVVLEQPQKTLFIAMDEPFKFLHGMTYRKRALNMLYNTCSMLGIQAVIVHQSDDANTEDDEALDVLSNKSDCVVHTVKLVAYEQSELATM